jgi:hypothetical protein
MSLSMIHSFKIFPKFVKALAPFLTSHRARAVAPDFPAKNIWFTNKFAGRDSSAVGNKATKLTMDTA